MRGTTLNYFSQAMCALALVACAAAGYMAWNLSARISAREALEVSASTQATQDQSAAMMHTLAQNTQVERSELDAMVQTDVLGVANTITSAGESAGAATTIGTASAESAPANSTSGVSALDFVVEAQGSFAQVFRAAQLFATLPVPSSIQSLDFERQSASSGAQKGAVWQLTARIRVLTSAKVSS